MERWPIAKIHNKINEIRNRGGKRITNYYFSLKKSDDLFDTVFYPGTVIFIKRKIGCGEVFYFSVDENELMEGLARCPMNTMINLVVKKDKIPPRDFLHGTGYRLHSVFERFGGKLAETVGEQEEYYHNTYRFDFLYDESMGRIPQENEAYTINQVLYQVFDPYGDDLFTDSEMKDIIRDKRIYVEDGNDGEICCIYIWRIDGKKFYTNLIYNNGPGNISYSLQKKATLNAIRDYGVNYSYGWIRTNNKKALKRLEMTSEGIYSYIFAKKEKG